MNHHFLGISGARGFVGAALQEVARREGRKLLLFSRDPSSLPEGRLWSRGKLPDLHGCDQLIHLAGESILGPWTKKKKELILESRREGTRALVEAIAQAPRKPSVLVSASAIGYYGDRGGMILEERAASGNGFLAQVAQAWEREALEAQAYGVRVVLVRIGIVLGPKGGIMKLITPLFRLGLGGVLGSGEQWMSCIHVHDLARLLLQCANDPTLHGPLNAVAPTPITNKDFTELMGALLHRPTLLRIPSSLLQLGLGELSTLLLSSQRVIPRKALEHHFHFQYPSVASALEEILTTSPAR